MGKKSDARPPPRTKKPRPGAPANFIALWRQRLGDITQEALAERMHSSAATISRIENGAVGYSRKSLEGIAVALSIPAGYLLSRNPYSDTDAWALAEAIARLDPDNQKTIAATVRQMIQNKGGNGTPEPTAAAPTARAAKKQRR